MATGMTGTHFEFGVAVVELPDGSNPWDDWMDEFEGENLGWMRVVGERLRDVDIHKVADRLSSGVCMQYIIIGSGLATEIEEERLREVDWAFWLDCWKGPEVAPHDDLVSLLNRSLFVSCGARLKVSRKRTGQGWIEPRALLWLLLSAIRHWGKHKVDIDVVTPPVRWLLGLLYHDRTGDDPRAAVLANLYEAFRQRCIVPIKPLPGDLTIEVPAMVEGLRSSARARAGR